MLNNNTELDFDLPPVTRVLLLATIGIYLLQIVSGSFLPFDVTTMFALNSNAIQHWQLWRGITYIFLHGSIFHLFINMLVLFMFGREMESMLGARCFLSLYLGCGILGGVGWIIISGNSPAYCLGASGAIFGIIGAFAAMFPARKITLLLFFVIPITMTARVMAIGMAVVSVFALMGADGNIAHAAHLAGGLAGYFYGRNIRLSGHPKGDRNSRRRVNTRFRRKNIRIVPNETSR